MVERHKATNPIDIVSLGVVALNEQDALPGLLQDITSQDFPHERMQIVLVDGGSCDATRHIMQQFKNEHSGHAGCFHSVLVLANPRKIQAAGWNVVIDNACGDCVIRVDAHSGIAPDFVSKNVEVLDSGEWVCGGFRPTVIEEGTHTPWMDTLHLSEEAAFGSSVAAYRREGEAGYVDSVFHGAYRREVLAEVGHFDERLLRTEDNDFHFRIRQLGYQIRFDPAIRSEQHMRGSLKKMLKQKYGNGFWVGRTVYVQPGCLALHHFIPLVFILGIVLLTVIGLVATWMPFMVCGVLYALVCVLLAVRATAQSGHMDVTRLALPFVFMGIHISYGIGTVVGLIAGIVRPLKK